MSVPAWGKLYPARADCLHSHAQALAMGTWGRSPATAGASYTCSRNKGEWGFTQMCLKSLTQ